MPPLCCHSLSSLTGRKRHMLSGPSGQTSLLAPGAQPEKAAVPVRPRGQTPPKHGESRSPP
eukprot:1909399-Alexandrium_andersonii.AAC.1